MTCGSVGEALVNQMIRMRARPVYLHYGEPACRRFDRQQTPVTGLTEGVMESARAYGAANAGDRIVKSFAVEHRATHQTPRHSGGTNLRADLVGGLDQTGTV